MVVSFRLVASWVRLGVTLLTLGALPGVTNFGPFFLIILILHFVAVDPSSLIFVDASDRCVRFPFLTASAFALTLDLASASSSVHYQSDRFSRKSGTRLDSLFLVLRVTVVEVVVLRVDGLTFTFTFVRSFFSRSLSLCA